MYGVYFLAEIVHFGSFNMLGFLAPPNNNLTPYLLYKFGRESLSGDETVFESVE